MLLLLFCSNTAQRSYFSEVWPTDGRTHPLKQMRERIKKPSQFQLMTETLMSFMRERVDCGHQVLGRCDPRWLSGRRSQPVKAVQERLNRWRRRSVSISPSPKDVHRDQVDGHCLTEMMAWKNLGWPWVKPHQVCRQWDKGGKGEGAYHAEYGTCLADVATIEMKMVQIAFHVPSLVFDYHVIQNGRYHVRPNVIGSWLAQ